MKNIHAVTGQETRSAPTVVANGPSVIVIDQRVERAPESYTAKGKLSELIKNATATMGNALDITVTEVIPELARIAASTLKKAGEALSA